MANEATLKLQGINRLNQFGDPRLISEQEVTELNNCVLDQTAGKAIKRGSFSKGSIGSPLGAVPGVTDVFSARLSSVGYVVIKLGATVYAYNGTTWSAVTGITTLDSSASLRHQIFNDRVYITDGVTYPRMSDLSTGQAMAITPPVTTSLDSYHKTGGNLAIGSYKYVITHRTPEGDESNPSTPFTHFVINQYTAEGNSTNVNYKTLKFTGLPAVTDTRVSTRVIYRTKVNGDIFYRWGIIDADTTEFIDNKADSELDESLNVNFVTTPTVVGDLASHKERLFAGNVTLTQKNFTELPNNPTESTDDGNWLGGGSWYADTTNLGGTAFVPRTYTYRIVLVSDEGIYSNYIDKAFDLSAAGTFDVITTYNFPKLRISGAFNNTYEIYRKDTGSGGADIWYYHPDLSAALNGGSANQLDDTILDLSANKVWATPTYDDINYDNGIIWSEIGQPTNFKTTSILRIFPDDGDTITAIYDDKDGLIVFKENSICKVFTQGSSVNWRVVKIVEERGCDDINSIHKTNDRYYFTHNKQVYIYPISLNEDISIGIKDQITPTSTITSVAYSVERKWFIINIVDGSTGKSLIYDEEINSWYTFTYTNFYITGMYENKYGSGKGDLLWTSNLDDNVGVYDKDGTLDYDGNTDAQSYSMTVQSKIWLSPDLRYQMRFRRLFSTYTKDASKTVTHTINGVNLNDTINSGDCYIETDNFPLVTHTPTIQYKVSGVGLREFVAAEIKVYMTRRRSNAL